MVNEGAVGTGLDRPARCRRAEQELRLAQLCPLAVGPGVSLGHGLAAVFYQAIDSLKCIPWLWTGPGVSLAMG